NLIGGDGGLLAESEAAIERYGLQDKIHILGYRNDIDQLMAQSQIFVLSSNWEGFPLTIIEAMRAKMPVIASNVGGVSEAVINDETGYLTNSKDELVIALKTLITDPEKRLALGNQGRKNYEKYFTIEIQLENTFELYNKLLQG
ncbi:MAG: glycosyltransferase, partial [Thiotrichaceae bacterium]